MPHRPGPKGPYSTHLGGNAHGDNTRTDNKVARITAGTGGRSAAEDRPAQATVKVQRSHGGRRTMTRMLKAAPRGRDDLKPIRWIQKSALQGTSRPAGRVGARDEHNPNSTM